MSRSSRYKALYFVVILSAAAAALLVLQRYSWNPSVIVVVGLLLVLPGRIQGVLLRDLFRGRAALDVGEPSKALQYFERFQHTLSRQPWRKHALWLSWSVYTPNLSAMLLNNIGAAYFSLGETSRAKDSWQLAIELDQQYPHPFANMALVAAGEGDEFLATELISHAKTLGYSGRALDSMISKMQSLLARVESGRLA